ncbi:hypothetical protein BVE84_05360 [Streptococcus azizii]|uniref:Uncharacterized protein n=1 Tax=Streptococcus azizii TaxID=1579424 RepID=A0AB36JN51_9STRE|nr:hypothetical protein BVE86_09765 [Streptococcus azizii]ONK28243.1 hypothetical protein BVE85_05365 [Streptococcus azizii]ONK29019.1 hypothetical protein BVE84_05360 [Streptococcus azizii]
MVVFPIAFYIHSPLKLSLILFKNQIQTTSASPCRTAVQPSASFLVCFLIFIEYHLSCERLGGC